VNRSTVEARFRKVPKKGDTFYHFVVHCGRQGVDCGFPLGRIYALSCCPDENARDPESYAGFIGLSDWAPGIANMDLTLGLCGLETATVISAPSGHRIWVAWHEIAYRQLDDGDFVPLLDKSPTRNPWRMASNGRARGSCPLPGEMATRIREAQWIGDGNSAGLAPGGYGIVGKNPALPAVIRCPRCDTRNRLLPLAFDERRAMWYTVRTG
jgi:hypothetical protein